MMFKKAFVVFLLAHTLGDFYFQTDKLAEQKDKSLSKAFLHSLIYALTCSLVILPLFNKWLAMAAAFVCVSHLLIDLSKWYFINKGIHINLRFYKKYIGGTQLIEENKNTIYIIDQIFHLICIFAAALFITRNCDAVRVLPFIDNIFQLVGIGKFKTLSYLLLLLISCKPSNITINKMLYAYKPDKTQSNGKTDSDEVIKTETKVDSEKSDASANTENKNAGKFIGILERIVIILFLSLAQYSAIGLVLTAKSIARYNRIVEEKKFAEYYLLGTLLSSFFAIISYLIIM